MACQVLSGQQTLPRLFCVPLLVKDNFDTVGMAATNGAVGLLDNYPSQDAHQVTTKTDGRQPCKGQKGPLSKE